MALKKKLTKVEYDKLSVEMKKLYKEGEYSDTFELDTEDDEDDPAELRRALMREKADRKKAQKELKRLKEDGAANDDNTDDDDDNEDNEDNEPPAGNNKKERRALKDAKRIDDQWKKKHAKDIGERDTKLTAKDAFIKKQLINGTADRIAREISTAPGLLSKAIAARLDVDFDADEPELVILGDDGKPAAITLEKLTKEFRDNKEYAAIIIGSKATGGGAPKGGTEKPTGGSAPASGDTKVDLTKLSGKDLAEAIKARKEAKQQGA